VAALLGVNRVFAMVLFSHLPEAYLPPVILNDPLAGEQQVYGTE